MALVYQGAIDGAIDRTATSFFFDVHGFVMNVEHAITCFFCFRRSEDAILVNLYKYHQQATLGTQVGSATSARCSDAKF